MRAVPVCAIRSCGGGADGGGGASLAGPLIRRTARNISSVPRYFWSGNHHKADIGFHSNVHSHLSNIAATSTLFFTQRTFYFTFTPRRLTLPPPLPLFRTFYLMVAQNITTFLFQFTLFTFHLSQAGCQKEFRNSWHGTHRQ